MTPTIKNWLLACMSTLLLCCSNGSGVLSNNDCKNKIAKANSYLNEFYIDGNEKSLIFSLSIIDSVIDLCPENKSQMVSLKITLLTLLKDYEKGFQFVSTLEKEGFDKTYKRNMYMNTFRALSFENKGDTLQRDAILKELADEIGIYVKENPTDKSAIADLYFTKIRFASKENVIKEIDQIKDSDQAGNDFYEALKESIKFAPEM